MKIRIDRVDTFYDMLKDGEIKQEWSLIENYGIDVLISAAFEENLDYENINTATHKQKGVLEVYLYKVVSYKGIHVNRAYVHKNGDVILMSNEGDRILVVENKSISTRDFNN